MTFTKLVCVVLLVTVLVLVVKPARAEAMDPIFISLIISGAIVVIALVAILIIANVSEGRRRGAESDPVPLTPLVVLETSALGSSTFEASTLEPAATETVALESAAFETTELEATATETAMLETAAAGAEGL